MSDSVRPHGLQPTRLLRPWDSAGKNTGVGCHCLLRVWTLTMKKLCTTKGHWKKSCASTLFIFWSRIPSRVAGVRDGGDSHWHMRGVCVPPGGPRPPETPRLSGPTSLARRTNACFVSGLTAFYRQRLTSPRGAATELRRTEGVPEE